MVILELFYLMGVKAFGLGIFVSSWFNKKAQLWIEGRNNNLTRIGNALKPGEKRIWFHCPSLGEFEQGRPVLEAICRQYPDHKIVLTFFSPSGYEIRKNDPSTDYVFYLPLDGPFNSLDFINLVKPEMAFFVKYDFWHYYIKILKEKKIPSYFISCIFRPSQIYFKWYGFFFKKILRNISHLFVQNQTSLQLLYQHSVSSVSVSGDTRFDRVYDNSLNRKEFPEIARFKNNKQLFIAGSSWPQDDDIYTDIINEGKFDMKWIIAPHEMDEEQLNTLQKKITVTSIRYSEINPQTDLPETSVLIIDNVGILSSLYAYADFAMIGGGFGHGIHNILEAAVYGIPVVFGPKYDNFQEARDLLSKKGAYTIKNKHELYNLLYNILPFKEERERIRNINTNYILENKGATKIIMNFLKMNH